jgi:multisubunit Na+/H+ antiporter MnhG subunit
MLNNKNDIKINNSYRGAIYKTLVVVGNALTLIGGIFFLAGLVGLIRLDDFALGLSSGVRMIGMVVIAGCLLSAIGYGFLDYMED